MPIPVLCPGCNARLNAPDAAAGRNVKCPKCQALMTIPAKETPAMDFDVLDEPAPKQRPPAPVKRPVKTDVMLDDDDDDDRPRRRRRDPDEDERPRKKGKQKASGPPVGLLVGGGLAAILLLVGVGYAIYHFGFREKDPDTVAAGSDGTKAGPPEGWVQYKPETGGFQVHLPTAPRSTPRGPTGEVRSPFSLTYTGESEEPMIQCQIQKIHFPHSMSAADREAYLAEKLDPKKEKAPAFGGLKEVGRGSITLAGKPGTEVVIELDLGEAMKNAPPQAKLDRKGRPLPTKIVAVARGIIADDRGYIVSIMTPESRSTNEKGYFDSFELVPETNPEPKNNNPPAKTTPKPPSRTKP